MKVSVISATYNRAELLDNALQTYSKQTLSKEDWEYLICDDMSQDDTIEVVEKWIKKGLPLRYFTAEELGFPKEPGQWRDGCTLRNAVSTHAFGEVLVATHPEIMIPPNALEILYETVKKNEKSWITAIPYWLPDSPLAKNWRSDLSNLKKTEGFYDPSWPDEISAPGAIDYRNQNQEIRKTWESEVFWAMDMHLWRWMGGFTQFEAWGSVDMDFLQRRSLLGIKTVIAKDEKNSLMVYHQYHESKRDMDLAMAEARKQRYTNAEDARKSGGLFPIYNHGHRERANDGKIGGVLGDHVARYEFAANYAKDKIVLDVPCATGYGAFVLNNATDLGGYAGVDIDAESISFAEKNVVLTETQKEITQFKVGSMTHIPFDDDTFDMLLCYEGLEHIDDADRKLFVKEMQRVLKPNGTFIISTPQKGIANGTPWDKYIMTKAELKELFKDWANLDWYYQLSYGARSQPHPTVYEKLPKAEVMVLGGTNTKKVKNETPDG